MDEQKVSKASPAVSQRLIICGIVLVVGIVGMVALAGMKAPPAESELKERPLRVEVQSMAAEDVPVTIRGYGQVKTLNTVRITPEVSGRIVAVHPRLEQGEVIPSGELLFRIDDRDYRASLDEAHATVQQLENTVLRLGKELSIYRQRLKTLARSQDLARDEHERLKRLFQEDRVGTRSGMDNAERTANSASDQASQMAQAVTLYPVQIKEAEHNLAAARARMDRARTQLERCTVYAPFTGRIKQVAVELDQYVSPGATGLTLADDSVLEIQVPLDSRDVREWLEFKHRIGHGDTAWFEGLKHVDCKIRWTEAMDDGYWQGRPVRIVRFEQQTRTLTIAVRVDGAAAQSNATGNLPLVEGMFCQVDIPGRVLRGIYRVPRWAVSYDQKLFVVRDQRLKTVAVTVARIQGEEALISGGINPGDQVIVTRLVAPLENALLEITETRS